MNMNNIDVFLSPLVEKLKTLWMPSVQALDFAHVEGHRSFNLCIAIISK